LLPTHCGVVCLTPDQAIEIAMTWPPQHVIDFAREHDQLAQSPASE
jgi:hypothetical protein